MSQLDEIKPLLDQAIAARAALFDSRRESAFRLFNGFYEGYPDLVLDVYGRTVVIHNHADNPYSGSFILFTRRA
jgi:23S rRNA (cytosine1962-C5)-methyltransferase